MTDNPLLIETCMEGGSKTAEEVLRTLKGKAALPEIKAVVSMLEHAIAVARNRSEAARGVERDEFCGAARELREVRARLNSFLAGVAP
jgi:hypothetical protein